MHGPDLGHAEGARVKAIIPAAGMGTRFLPVTKAIPKEMLPVVDKPIIQYAAEEAAAAGATDILIITGRGKRAIEDHFDRSAELERALSASGKDEQCKQVQAISEIANVFYVRQKSPRGLGHAVSVGAPFVNSTPFYVLLGDVVVPEMDILPKMRAAHEATGGSVIAVAEVAPHLVDRYGVIAGRPADEPGLPAGTWRVDTLVEKPPVGTAPSNLAVVGRYLLAPQVMDILASTEPGLGGEIQLTDALVTLAERAPLYAVTVPHGAAFDTGNVLSWLEANITVALGDPEYAEYLRAYVRPLLEG